MTKMSIVLIVILVMFKQVNVGLMHVLDIQVFLKFNSWVNCPRLRLRIEYGEDKDCN